jgi:phytoene synthase
MIRCGSRSFFLASLLLPDEVREAAYALYGFCRLSDDAVDTGDRRSDAVARLRGRLARVYAGDPAPEPVDRALADAVLRFAIPRALLEALLEGLEWDTARRDYETLEEVYAYAARVAGSVGAMMAALMGARSAALIARACDLGVAMQLTNIARDVGEDARMGRLYLPRSWMREAGVDPDAFLANPVFSPALAGVVARLLGHAETLYRRSEPGIAGLAPPFQPAIFAARHLYAEIGALVARRGFDSIRRRASVSVARKLWLLCRAARRAGGRAGLGVESPPLAEVRFLVEAVVREEPRFPPATRPRGLGEGLAWTLDLFASLEMRNRSLAAAR